MKYYKKTITFKLSWKGWRSRGGGWEDQSQEQTFIKLRWKGWKSNGEVGRDQMQEQQEAEKQAVFVIYNKIVQYHWCSAICIARDCQLTLSKEIGIGLSRAYF